MRHVAVIALLLPLLCTPALPWAREAGTGRLVAAIAPGPAGAVLLRRRA